MTSHSLLRSVRSVYVLAKKPALSHESQTDYWAVSLPGLHQDDLRSAVNSLRQSRKGKIDDPASLKTTHLLRTLAQSLGSKDYDSWGSKNGMQQRIFDFLSANDMHQPANLIDWDWSPGFAGRLTARQVSDRLFASNLPLPERVFTGVGSTLFAPSGYGRQDISWLAKREGVSADSDEERFLYCTERVEQKLLKAEYFRKSSVKPAFLEMTGRMLMLNSVSEYVGCMYTLLGSNLTEPSIGSPEFRSYNMSGVDRDFEMKIFRLFREEIESSSDGWIDVLPMPGNNDLIFLRGPNGTFDWVVRDQRDELFSINPFFPMFKTSELPSALLQGKLKAHLYFSRGQWLEKLEHEAETRHYNEGGTGEDWPGYDALIEREMMATYAFHKPRPITGAFTRSFVPHRLTSYCLMVSDLVTVDEFWEFYERSGWKTLRVEAAKRGGYEIEEHLSPVNFLDTGDSPASVTWLDAIAFCADYERRTGLPVRLLDREEWSQIAPEPTIDLTKLTRAKSFVVVSADNPMPPDEAYDEIGWAIYGGDDVRGGNSSHRYLPGGVLKFGPNLSWVTNKAGLEFLSVAGFAEWLGNYRSGHAPTACAATGRALLGGSLARDVSPIHLSMKYKGAKVGFRLCYAALADA